MHLLSTSPPARFTRTCCGPVRSPSVGDVHGASDAHDEAANGSILDVLLGYCVYARCFTALSLACLRWCQGYSFLEV
jgi:hypothetical protein